MEKQTQIMAMTKKKQTVKKSEDDNIIRFAGKEEAIYDKVIIDKLQRYDEILIRVTNYYKDSAEFMVRKWAKVLEFTEETRWGVVPWKIIDVDAYPDDSKKSVVTQMYQVKLRKHPDFFKHTE